MCLWKLGECAKENTEGRGVKLLPMEEVWIVKTRMQGDKSILSVLVMKWC